MGDRPGPHDPKTRHLVRMAIMGSEIQFKDYEQHQGQLFPAHLSDVTAGINW